jgi:hypothetical protein
MLRLKGKEKFLRKGMEGKGIVKPGQESQTGCSYFGNEKKTWQNRTKISETSRRNRSNSRRWPLPVVRRRGLAAGGCLPSVARGSASPARDPSGAMAAAAAGGERRRGTRARPRLVGLGWKRRAVGPARGQVGTRKRGEFLVIFFHRAN